MTRAAQATPPGMARKIKGLSDRTIAWLFVAPTIFLLLAVNIFPLVWTIRLSFTNYRANRPNADVQWIGTRNYERILTDSDIWLTMQATAHFLFWTILFQVLIGFTLAWLINRKFKGNDLWTTIIVLPMMLSPAVVGNFWTFLYQPQIGLFNYVVAFLTGTEPTSFSMIGDVNLAPWSIVIVDTWMWTPFVMLICLAGLRSIPGSIYEAAECDRASKWRQFWTITVPMTLPFLMLAVLFRGIENFKMVRSGRAAHRRRAPDPPPSSPRSTSSARPSRSGAPATPRPMPSCSSSRSFGLASIYVKALNKVKER